MYNFHAVQNRAESEASSRAVDSLINYGESKDAILLIDLAPQICENVGISVYPFHQLLLVFKLWLLLTFLFHRLRPPQRQSSILTMKSMR